MCVYLPGRVLLGENDPATHFLKAVLSWKPEAGKLNNFITLPGGVLWPSFRARTLYKRHFYDDFYDGVLNKFPFNQKYILMGTAGIGTAHSIIPELKLNCACSEECVWRLRTFPRNPREASRFLALQRRNKDSHRIRPCYGQGLHRRR